MHAETLDRIRAFWRILLKSDVDIGALSATAEKIQHAEKRCSDAYDRLLERFPNSVKVLKSYGRFIEFVKNDADSAQKHYDKATQLVQVEQHSQKRTVNKSSSAKQSRRRFDSSSQSSGRILYESDAV
jgi:hypothetical protein